MKWKANSHNGKRDVVRFALFPTRVGDDIIWFRFYVQSQTYYLGSWLDERSYYCGRRIK